MKRPDRKSQKNVDAGVKKPGQKKSKAPGYAEPDQGTSQLGNRGGENPHGDEMAGQGADEEDGKTAGNDRRGPKGSPRQAEEAQGGDRWTSPASKGNRGQGQGG